MAKILSQDEIDALLTTVSSGEDQPAEEKSNGDKLRSVITYDFKHPNRVSKDQISVNRSVSPKTAAAEKKTREDWVALIAEKK